ncbi:PP0621 family protein [Undibacterium sp. SXout7W]|uniref:PP0621 family protein n=1 Tax=Undibacterium sp. SXout7W TaxID=3413049 RepID=UPI003BF3F1FD
MRALMWLGLLVLVILALKKKSQPSNLHQQTTQNNSADVPRPGPASAGTIETMVCCAHCQIYLPASEAIYRGQQVYCSTAHADLH